MATVVVTGAMGTVGRWTVARLAGDHEVVGVDLERPEEPRRDVDYRAADLARPGAARELLASTDADAVVHLAAIPTARRRTGGETFETNATVAYNVLDAAGERGTPVVWTSSACVYGYVFVDESRLPERLPIDVDHPTEPRDPYSTSKLAAEAVAGMVSRRHDVPVTTVRPSWVQEPGAYETADARSRFDLDDPRPDGGFWSYVDVRDLASLIGAALDASLAGDLAGHRVYNAAAPDTYLETPTRDAIRAAYGDLPDDCGLEGTDGPYSTCDVRRDLGWGASHDWRSAETESVPVPDP